MRKLRIIQPSVMSHPRMEGIGQGGLTSAFSSFEIPRDSPKLSFTPLTRSRKTHEVD
jgi:hypothetical protein